MTAQPDNAVKITAIEPRGDKVCVTLQMTVDVHCLAEAASKLLAAAAKGASSKKKK